MPRAFSFSEHHLFETGKDPSLQRNTGFSNPNSIDSFKMEGKPIPRMVQCQNKTHLRNIPLFESASQDDSFRSITRRGRGDLGKPLYRQLNVIEGHAEHYNPVLGGGKRPALLFFRGESKTLFNPPFPR